MTNTTHASHGASAGGAYAFTRNGYTRTYIHDLTADDVESAKVYGRDDETIGSISSLMIGADDKITDAVIDVGGFLGMGAHAVKVPFSGLTILRKADGSDVRVHLDTTKDRLKAMPHHKN
ncbi:MAG: PRC-barrel domain-containing protein [Oceanicaulis sp.]|nr:PRC-barrel domain-containing protein [Oceanicaulis sp.]